MIRDYHADAATQRAANWFGAIAGVAGIGLGGMLGALWDWHGWGLIAGSAATGVIVGFTARRLTTGFIEGAGNALLRFIQPSGSSTPYAPQFSQAQALAAAGDVDGAIAAYDAEMSRLPGNGAVRIQSADLHALHGRARRAEALFLEARRLTNDPGQELYCTQRLIDLRLGPLNAAAKALPEFRRIIDRFPGTPEAEGARRALAKYKADVPR